MFTLAVLMCAGGGSALACGPSFPNSFLEGGDAVMFRAPRADFAVELARIKIDAPRFHANHPTNGHAAQSFEVDFAELKAALKKSGKSDQEQNSLYESYRFERERVREFAEKLGGWSAVRFYQTESRPRPVLAGMDILAGEPVEFTDYLRGYIAFLNGQTNEARQSWLTLLERPKDERHYRSVWAAYMLGRTSDADQPQEAIKYYKLTRTLARTGFADSLGLAAASIGWEAKAHLEHNEIEQAFDLYLQHYAAGDDSAVASLRFTAHAALTNGNDVLKALAARPQFQSVITAHIIARSYDWQLGNENVRRWLEAVESADVREMESVEKLALAAYQHGEMAIAQRWINRARSSPTAQWLQAKLYLRAGKTQPAAQLLSRLTASFPLAPPDTNEVDSLSFKDRLNMPDSNYSESLRSSTGQHLLGELGMLQLARREYQESLDNLLRAEYWTDAAYVAERVLTIDELKSYVDLKWPLFTPTDDNPTDPESGLRQNIRYLLGRRLTRLNRGSEAGPYYPGQLQPRQLAFMQQLTEAWEPSRSPEQRATSFFEAAKIAREDGMELLGAEVEPDSRINGGGYESCLSPDHRATNEMFQSMIPSSDEVRRFHEHATDPDKRFHYRYQAASLAWEAAKLMPNNSDQTAMVLWTGGNWLKYQDPDFADIFYKALVRRCRKTPLGTEADRIRWFPKLDENGNIIPRPMRIKHLPEELPPESPMAIPDEPPGATEPTSMRVPEGR